MTQTALFDRDVIQPTEWDQAVARSQQRDITRRYHGGDHQSALAHRSIEPKKTAMQRQIHDYITSCGRKGATCAEVERDLGLRHESASARMAEMKRPDAEYSIFWNGLKRALEGRQPARAFVTSAGQLK